MDNTALPEVLPDLLQEFLGYWDSKRGDRELPARSDIDPADIKHMLPGICILDIEYNDTGFNRARFRLAGTEIIEMAGFEVTGHYVDEIVAEEIYQEIQEQFKGLVSSNKPSYRRFRWPGSPREYERVMVPVGEPGSRPKQLIGMHIITNDNPKEPSNENALPVPVG